MTELDVQRRLTREFIASGPTTIALIPSEAVVRANGGTSMSDGTPRTPQQFKLIPMTFNQRPTFTIDGVDRIIDYTLLGEWNSVMEVWDHWDDGEGGTNVIIALTDGHGYEKKGLVERRLPGR